MLTVLNRLRGTKGYFAHVTALAIAIVVYLTTSNLTVSILTYVGYVAGESFGWGKWIGSIINDEKVASEKRLAENEGTDNGVHWIANKVFPQTENYEYYCNFALGLRGFLWGFLTLLPLFVFGYISFSAFHLSALFIGVMFPISVHIGKYTTTKFNVGTYGSHKGFNMDGAWEHAEVWYGLAQDVVLISLLLSV